MIDKNITIKKPELSHFKIIMSGRHVEMVKYLKPYAVNLESDSLGRGAIRGKKEQKEISDLSMNRSKNKTRRLINSNAGFYKNKNGKIIRPQFATYTFAENMTDIKEANRIFTNYIKRLNYKYFRTKKAVIKYIVVMEFQKRGAVHYHAIFFNLTRIDNMKERKNRKFQKVWGQGFVDIRDISNTKNVGFYMVKYMGKGMQDKRLMGQKKYFASKGLYKPMEIKNNQLGESFVKIISKMKFENVNSGGKKNDHYGEMIWKSFEISNLQLNEIMLEFKEVIKNQPWNT